MPRKSPGISLNLLWTAALLVLLPILIFFLMRHIIDNERSGYFRSESARYQQTVQERIGILAKSLDATQGFLAASSSVERDEWKIFTERLNLLSDRPGIMHIAFIERTPAARLSDFVRAVREDRSLRPEGYPDFKVFPAGDRAEYYPVKYLNPGDGDRLVMGFDLGSEPVRLQTLRRAVERGEAQATPAVRRLDIERSKWIVLFISPVYREGADTATPLARFENLQGFINIVVDIEDFFREALSRGTSARFPIYSRVWIEREPSESSESRPIFDNRPPDLRKRASAPFFRRSRVEVFGSEWQFEFFADERFGLSLTRSLLPTLAGLAGFLVSGLVFWIILLARSGQAKAYAMASQMTRDLEASRQRLLMAQSAAQFGAWDWDLQTNRVYWTDEQCRIYGLSPAEQGRLAEWEARVHPDDLPGVMTAVQKSLETNTAYSAEFRILPIPGVVRWIAARGKVHYDETGKPVRMVGIDMDITDRKKFESQLLQSQKMETVGTLAGGIAHDLNNQLSPLLGYVDLILQQTPADSPSRDMLEEARAAGERCADIVKRLLHFSRPSTQKKEPVELNKILLDIKRTLTQFLPSTIKTEFRLEAPLGVVLANETELQTVFMNLAANARDAMPGGGLISIRARAIDLPVGAVPAGCQAGRYILCAFRDTGSGMSPELLGRIFEPFFSTKERGKGTGLGLAMVFGIVKDHGGWLDVSSRPGDGTTFQIFLPTTDRVPLPAKAGNGVLPPAKASGRVLFADDEEYMRNLGKTFLERLGYTTVTASSGPETVDRFERETEGFCAVVLDMTMPGQTGIQTIKRLLAANPRVRIVAASGHTTEGTPEELQKIGVREYIHKPYTIQTLAAALERAAAA